VGLSELELVKAVVAVEAGKFEEEVQALAEMKL
jgi:hypothetical protein